MKKELTNTVNENNESHLSNNDIWYKRTLESLLGGESYAVKVGVKKEIDREMLAEWTKRHSGGINL